MVISTNLEYLGSLKLVLISKNEFFVTKIIFSCIQPFRILHCNWGDKAPRSLQRESKMSTYLFPSNRNIFDRF